MDAKTRNLALLAALSVALLHRHCLDDGSRCFRLGLFAFGVVDFRRSREALALKWTS